MGAMSYRVSRPGIVGGRSSFGAVAALMVAFLIPATPSSGGQLTIGSVRDFMTGSNAGNPAGTWTQGDKSFTYLSGIGSGWNGTEQIQVTDSPGPMIHTFAIGNLGGYTNTQLSLRYHLHVDDPNFRVDAVALDVLHLIDGDSVTKNVYGDSGFSQLLASLVSVNGSAVGFASLGLRSDLYVEDVITLTGNGLVNGIGNTYQQAAVPEIDMASLAAVCPFLMGCLALLERRGARRSIA